MTNIVQLQKPPHLERVETGVVQFEGDWPGIFIRGDNAMNYAFILGEFLKSEEGQQMELLSQYVLHGLEQTLKSCLYQSPEKNGK